MTNYRDPNDPFYDNSSYESPKTNRGGWGWIAGALAIIVVLGFVIGLGHERTRVASNDAATPSPQSSPMTATGLTPPPPPAPNRQ